MLRNDFHQTIFVFFMHRFRSLSGPQMWWSWWRALLHNRPSRSNSKLRQAGWIAQKMSSLQHAMHTREGQWKMLVFFIQFCSKDKRIFFFFSQTLNKDAMSGEVFLSPLPPHTVISPVASHTHFSWVKPLKFVYMLVNPYRKIGREARPQCLS